MIILQQKFKLFVCSANYRMKRFLVIYGTLVKLWKSDFKALPFIMSD